MALTVYNQGGGIMGRTTGLPFSAPTKGADYQRPQAAQQQQGRQVNMSAYSPGRAQSIPSQSQGTPYGREPRRGATVGKTSPTWSSGTPVARPTSAPTPSRQSIDVSSTYYNPGRTWDGDPRVRREMERTNPVTWTDDQWQAYERAAPTAYAHHGGYWRDAQGNVRPNGHTLGEPLSPNAARNEHGSWRNTSPPSGMGDQPWASGPPRQSNYPGYDPIYTLDTTPEYMAANPDVLPPPSLTRPYRGPGMGGRPDLQQPWTGGGGQTPRPSGLTLAPTPEQEDMAAERQRWRSSGSPGYSPERQAFSWEQLNRLPAGQAVDARGNIGGGLGSTPEFQQYMATARRNSQAEQDAFNRWRAGNGGGQRAMSPMGSSPPSGMGDQPWASGPPRQSNYPGYDPIYAAGTSPEYMAANPDDLSPPRPMNYSGYAPEPQPGFTSTVTGLGGSPMEPTQFYNQRDALIQLLNQQNAQFMPYSGVGRTPGPVPSAPDIGSLWGQAGDMVNDGWRNPLTGGTPMGRMNSNFAGQPRSPQMLGMASQGWTF